MDMKTNKYIVVLLIIALIIIAAFLGFKCALFIENSATGKTIADKYGYTEVYLRKPFSSYIDSEDVAVHIAEVVWIEHFGEAVLDTAPYEVEYDSEFDLWHIKGRLVEGYMGGVPHALIKKTDGSIVSIWYSK